MALLRPQTWLMPVATAGVAAVAGEVLPRVQPFRSVFGTTPAGKMAGQATVAVGGAFVLPMLGFRRLVPWWFVGALIPLVTDLVKTWVLPSIGLGAYVYQPQLGAYVYDHSYPALSEDYAGVSEWPPVESLPGRPALPVSFEGGATPMFLRSRSAA